MQHEERRQLMAQVGANLLQDELTQVGSKRQVIAIVNCDYGPTDGATDDAVS